MLLIDTVVVASIGFVCAAFLGVLRRARGSLTQWRTRDLLIATGMVAVGCGWWVQIERRWTIEQQVIPLLPQNCCSVSRPEERPDWLSRIVGREQLAAFDRVTLLNVPDDVDDRAIALLREPVRRLKSLSAINFNGNAFTDYGLADVLRFAAPRTIDISNTAVTGEGLSVLPAGCLCSLFAAGSKFNDAGMAAISHQSALENLNLAGTCVTDRGVRQLARMSNLYSLDLHGTQITEASVEALGQLQQLTNLLLPEDFSPSGFLRMQALLPNAALDMAPVAVVPAPAILVSADGMSGYAPLYSSQGQGEATNPSAFSGGGYGVVPPPLNVPDP
jgi:hypothetical protein